MPPGFFYIRPYAFDNFKDEVHLSHHAKLPFRFVHAGACHFAEGRAINVCKKVN
jgi:hypothetical protein